MNASAKELVQVRQLDDRAIFIVDGLFDDTIVRMIHETCKRLPFTRSEYANNKEEKIRYLNHNFDTDYLDKHPVMNRWENTIIARATALFPEFDYVVDRIHCNNQSYGDFRIVHADIVRGITALYFVNHEWPEEWHGETVFYDRNREPFSAVSPKPGRLLVFPGDVLHRGGSPSRMCFEPRLTVAFKFRPDKNSRPE